MIFMDGKNKKLLLIINPKAGKCIARDRLFDLVSIFSRFGFTVTVYPTKRDGTTEYVRENAAKYDRIVCCGGDGTCNEVLGGVAECGKKVPVGYIPTGSTNDFARTLGIPTNMLSAALTAATGKVVGYDMGCFNGRYFTYIAATGAFTAASYSAPQRLKNSLGHFAYIIEGAKCLNSIKPQRMTVEYDGKKIRGNFVYASVSNTTSVGGILKINDNEVNTCDGTFELLLAKKPASLSDGIDFVSDILSHRMNGKNIVLLHAAKVKISFEDEVYFTLDGEKSKPCREAVIENRHSAVNLIVPRGKA